MITYTGLNIFLAKNIQFKGTAEIGHCSIIGDFGDNPRDSLIGNNVKVGRFCFIEGGVNVGANFEADDYCGVYSTAQIGNNVKLLYGRKIYGRSIVGDNCIIGGDICERLILSDNVTFMGEVAHSHYNPKKDWDLTDEPSPTIGEGTIVGVNAILVGGIHIGKNCYISAGEILRHDLEDNMVFYKNHVYPIINFKGFLNTRF